MSEDRDLTSNDRAAERARELDQLGPVVIMAMRWKTEAEHKREGIDRSRLVELGFLRPVDQPQLVTEMVLPGDERLRWEPGLDPDFTRTATLAEAGAVWAGAQAWSDTDTRAARAQERAEQRLADFCPDVMDQYQFHRRQGMEPLGAMMASAMVIRGADEYGRHRGDVAAGLARNEADRDHQGSGILVSDTSEERHQTRPPGAPAGSGSDAPVTDAGTAQVSVPVQFKAAALAAQAYPQAVDGALATGSARPAPGASEPDHGSALGLQSPAGTSKRSR